MQFSSDRQESTERSRWAIKWIPAFVWVMIAGGLGAVARVATGLLVGSDDASFPWATFVCNMLGSAGLVWIRLNAARALWRSMWWQRVVGTGFFGAYTTFSAFGYETWVLHDQQGSLIAGGYVVGSVLGGACMAWLIQKAVRQYG